MPTQRRSAPLAETLPADPVDIAAFCRVVDLGSVTAAARDLGEGKGTVSRRIDRLESRLGVALLQRSGRSVSPTDAGLLYRERAGAALDHLADAAAMVRDQQRSPPSGHLRVTAPLGIGAEVLAPLLGPFATAYPDVILELVLTDQVLSFDRDRVDVALRLSAQLPDSELVATRLATADGTLVATPGYLARAGVPVHPADLDAHTLLLPPLRGLVTPMSFTERARPDHVVDRLLRGRVLSHDLSVLRVAALDGAGIALSSTRAVAADLAAGRLLSVLPGWSLAGRVGLWLLTRGGPLPPKVKVFRDHLVQSTRGSA